MPKKLPRSPGIFWATGPIEQVLAQGENKISFRLVHGLQVDVRLLQPENFGAALIYFTGSKEHNVALRGRALKMGYTLNEYQLATVAGEAQVPANHGRSRSAGRRRY